MWTPSSQGVAYAAYLGRLGFGLADFIIHRRAALPQTSGVRESALHGVQIFFVGIGVLVWAVFESSWAVAALLGGLAVLHAVAAYADTMVADATRHVAPVEQHVHSVLDIAPWGFAAFTAFTAEPTWALTWDSKPISVWAALILPPVPLVLMPWVAEFRAAVLANRLP